MADRRADETPLAPRRTTRADPTTAESAADRGKRPLSERVSAAVSAAGTAVQSGGLLPVRARPRQTRPELQAGPVAAVDGLVLVGRRPTARPPRAPARPALRLVHLDPWSVMKTSFLLSIAFGIVTVVAVAVVWSVLGAAGVWDSIN